MPDQDIHCRRCRSCGLLATSGRHRPIEHELDFRVGGREVARGRHRSGSVLTFESMYHAIVPNERVVYASALYGGEILATVSLTTVEFVADGDGTRLRLTEQGSFLDGQEEPAWREQGTRDQLAALDAELRRDAGAGVTGIGDDLERSRVAWPLACTRAGGCRVLHDHFGRYEPAHRTALDRAGFAPGRAGGPMDGDGVRASVQRAVAVVRALCRPVRPPQDKAAGRITPSRGRVR